MGLRPGDYEWTPERVAKAKAMYVAGDVPHAEIAAAIGGGATALTVRRKAANHKWAELRSAEAHQARRARTLEACQAAKDGARAAAGRFVWTDGALARLKALYGEGVVGERAATALGCTGRQAIVKACRLGLDGGRGSAEARADGARKANFRRSARATEVARAAAAVGRLQREQADRTAIDAALAAGRVTVCPPGRAGGLSMLELHTGFVPGPPAAWMTARRAA